MHHLVRACILSSMFAIAAIGPAFAQTPEQALAREADYLVDCSYTDQATHHPGVSPDSPAYGVINNVRIVDRGPDWVNQSVDAAMGLAAATAQLKTLGHASDRYDVVLRDHFMVWMLAHKQPFVTDSASPDYGGATSSVTYDASGQFVKKDRVSSGATADAVCAMWKYTEYLNQTGQGTKAHAWARDAWPLAAPAGEFLLKNIDQTYGLIHTRSDDHEMWVGESVLAVDALECLAAWASDVHQPGAERYTEAATQLRAGIEKMRDDGQGKADGWKNYYKFRAGDDPTKPQYGDSVDQLCFAPYEFDALPASEPFAKSISDWWTQGSYGAAMTPQTSDVSDWRYYGCHWHYYFDKRADNDHLYPGPTLQIAAMEWKIAKATGDSALMERAKRRYRWVCDADKSGLLYGSPANPDGGVAGGIVDWRSAADRTQKAPDWQRFSDTSAYFIYCTLMFEYGKDYKFVPQS